MGLGDMIEEVVEKFTGRDNDEPQGEGNVLPASQDPQGDPANQGSTADQQAGILPASQDPMGDPADQQSASDRQAGILPASQDPLGDPADQR